jgi:hypothetical protein
MEDLRNTFSNLLMSLTDTLKNVELKNDEKQLIKNVLDFGYSAAFCERTSDMTQSYFNSTNYRNGYEKIRKMLE